MQKFLKCQLQQSQLTIIRFVTATGNAFFDRNTKQHKIQLILRKFFFFLILILRWSSKKLHLYSYDCLIKNKGLVQRFNITSGCWTCFFCQLHIEEHKLQLAQPQFVFCKAQLRAKLTKTRQTACPGCAALPSEGEASSQEGVKISFKSLRMLSAFLSLPSCPCLGVFS